MPGLGPGIHELQRKRLIRLSSSAISEPANAKLVDARPKAWHDERGAVARGPSFGRVNLTAMESSPAMTTREQLDLTRRPFQYACDTQRWLDFFGRL